MKKYIALFLMFSTGVFAQNINDYKYALVPAKFSFFKEDNMYNLNLLTKMYLQKYKQRDFFLNMVLKKIELLVPEHNITV